MLDSHIKLVIFDCDLTLWNHSDATELKRPFMLVDRDTIRDQEGTLVSLFPQVRSCLAEVERAGCILSICSWNRPEPVFEMLSLFGLSHYFRHPKVEYHPHKHLMIERMIEEFTADGVALAYDNVVFTDDRTVHKNEIHSHLPGLHFVQMWVDVKDHDAFVTWLKQRL